MCTDFYTDTGLNGSSIFRKKNEDCLKKTALSDYFLKIARRSTVTFVSITGLR